MAKKNIKEVTDKVKELIGNIDEQEKEAFKEGLKEAKALLEELRKEKQTTGKVSTTSWIVAAMFLIGFGNATYTSITTPTVDDMKANAIEVVDSVLVERDSTYTEVLNTKVDEEDLSKMIRIEDGIIVIGEVE